MGLGEFAGLVECEVMLSLYNYGKLDSALTDFETLPSVLTYIYSIPSAVVAPMHSKLILSPRLCLFLINELEVYY